MPRKVNFMVSLTNYRIQLSSAPCNYKTKINFQKTALFVFSKCIVLGHAMFGGRGIILWFVLFAIGKKETLATFPHLQDEIKLKSDQKICFKDN